MPFKGIDLKLASDIAICKVAQIDTNVPHQPLAIVQTGLIGTGMAIGKTASAIGYGDMKNVALEAKGPSVISGDFSFSLHVSKGRIEERFPDNHQSKAVSTPGPCFSIGAEYPGGMSGSPILDDERIYVHGIVSKGWNDKEVWQSMGLRRCSRRPFMFRSSP